MRPRWALVVMGAWIAGSICMSVVATENFYTIDRLLGERPNSHFAAAVTQIGQPAVRDLLRYLSSELNRLYFQLWNWAQVALGACVVWLVISGTSITANPKERYRVQAGVAAMLAIVAVMILYLTPAIVSLGRTLDFVPRSPAPAGMQRFWILHASYTTLEMIKLIIGCVVTYWIQAISKHPAHITV